MKFSARWLVWARRLFIPIALAFLAYSAYRAGDSLAPLLADISVAYLLVACVCWSAAQWVGPFATVAFARILGIPLGYRELSLISVLRLPAKYLPGGVWQSVARFAAYREHAVRNTDSFFILMAEHLVALGTSTALGAGILLCMDNAPAVDRIAPWVLVAGVALLVVPAIWILRVRPDRKRKLAWMMPVVGATALFWCLAAVAFCAYWAAIFGLQAASVPGIASGYLLSWAAGFAAVFAPQGLGVFEWVAAHLLPSAQALSVTVTAVAGFRLVAIAGDLVAWVVGVLVSQASSRHAR